MKRKMLPLIIMLTAGAVVGIVTYIMHYELELFLEILLAVLLVFYIVGCLIKRTLDSFDQAEEKGGELSDEGEVIEKEPEEGKEQEETETSGEEG